MSTLTSARLLELLHYDPDTGKFFTKKSRGGIRSGSVSGAKCRDGYLRIQIDGKTYRAHRLAWLYVYGVWPVDELDHINGTRSDNRIANLRNATRSENHQNLPVLPANTSRYPGAHWHRRDRKWVANIRVNGKRKYLGRFDSAEEAGAAYVVAKAKLHTFQPTVRGFPQ